MGAYVVLRESDGRYIYQDNENFYSFYTDEESLKGHGVPGRY